MIILELTLSLFKTADRNLFYKTSSPMSSHIRAFSTTTSQTAPVLQGSQQEFSPLKTLDLPVYTRNRGNGEIAGGTSTAARQRLPEQCHSRERASYGGSSSGAGVDVFSGASSSNPLVPSEEAFRSPIPSDGASYGSNVKVSVSSPISGSFYSQDNFNNIKSVSLANIFY